MGVGGLLLDADGHPILLNDPARRILLAETAISRPNCSDEGDWAERSLKMLVARGGRRFKLNSGFWLAIPRDDKRDLILHSVDVANGNDTGPHTVVMIIDLQGTPRPRSEVIQNMFGLTAAEARLAIDIAGGASPADAAAERGVSIATIRSQLASVFSKTQTGRQAELVALLARVAVLP